jgi:hypothetical protein
MTQDEMVDVGDLGQNPIHPRVLEINVAKRERLLESGSLSERSSRSVNASETSSAERGRRARVML